MSRPDILDMAEGYRDSDLLPYESQILIRTKMAATLGSDVEGVATNVDNILLFGDTQDELHRTTKRTLRKLRDGKVAQTTIVVDQRLDSVIASPFPLLVKSTQLDVIIHVIRHAQAENNVSHTPGKQRGQIPNPGLTPHGVEECQEVLFTFPYMSTVTHVLCSPLKCTIDTAFLSFQPIFDQGIKAILLGQLKEWGNSPSNTGPSLAVLREELVDRPVEFRALNPRWELQKDRGDRAKRANLMKSDLHELVIGIITGSDWKGVPIKRETGHMEMLVVSHGSFLSTLVGKESCSIHNTQFRSYRFAHDGEIRDGLGIHDLVETEESKARKHIKLPKPENRSEAG